MRSAITYFCEICNTEYQKPEFALACEALGMPSPMPFIRWGEDVPVFCESGVIFTKQLCGAEVRRNMASFGISTVEQVKILKHEWWVRVRPSVVVSHNIYDDYGWFPAKALDPRFGYEAFRYHRSFNNVQIWADTLTKYGFTEVDVGNNIRRALDGVNFSHIQSGLQADLLQPREGLHFDE